MIRAGGSNPTETDSLAANASAETAIGRPTATARRLVNASVSDNTRRAYAGALGQLDAWLDGRQLDDAALAAHLGTWGGGALFVGGDPTPRAETTRPYLRSIFYGTIRMQTPIL